MKHLSFIVLVVTFGLNAAAQKSKVLSAYNYEQAYYTSKDCRELAKAVEAIELGLTDEVASEWSKTWFYRGNIYFAIYASEDDQCRRISEDALNISYDAYMKAIKLDEKQRYIKDIEPKISIIASFYLQRGANQFNTKNYVQALSDFEKAVEVARYFQKTDTTALYYAALSSDKISNPGKASLYYQGLIDIGYKDPKVFHFLAQDYYALGDTLKAFQAIKAGRIAFPSNSDLVIDELNYYIKNHQTQLALDNLDQAIKLMPDNAELYYAKGTTLDNIGEWEQAKDAYEKAVSIKPDHINANYNLGALYFNKGVEFANSASNFGEKEVAQYKEAEMKAEEYFKKALPFLEKANALDPQDRSTLISLKNLYSRMGNEEGYKRVSNILDN